MKKLFSFIIIFFITSALFTPKAQCGIWDPFHTKEEKISMWKELWDAHPTANYTSVGKTYAGNDIWLFMAGNFAGGTILWDGEIHGNEDKGSELLFLMAEWLLESGDSKATRILEGNYILFIPQLNDQDTRGNANTEISPYGVDINRNFENGWWLSSPSDDTYGGPYPLSEPETLVLREVFSTYNPIFYVNMHCGAGPYAAYYKESNTTLTQEVVSKTNTLCESWGISPYPNPSFGSTGFAIGDAIDLGVESAWLIETVGRQTAWRHLQENYDELVEIYLPKCSALFIAMAEVCSSTPVPVELLEITQSPYGSLVFSNLSVTINATFKDSTNIESVFIQYWKDDQPKFITNMYMSNVDGNIWSGKIPPMPDGTQVTYTINAKDSLGNLASSEIKKYLSYDPIIPEFSSPIILFLINISFLVIIITKRYVK